MEFRNLHRRYREKGQVPVPMLQGRWMEATDDYRRIRVALYVALMASAVTV